MFSLFFYPTAAASASISCPDIQPSASTVVETTTVYGTVTETPSVSIVHMTVVSTDVVTTTLDRGSCSPSVIAGAYGYFYFVSLTYVSI